MFSALDPAMPARTTTPTPGADILTYVLSGDDAKYFEIKGSVGDPGGRDDFAVRDLAKLTDL